MNWKNLVVLIVVANTLGLLVACQGSQILPIGENIVSDVKSTIAAEPTAVPTTEPIATPESALAFLPERSGPRTQTTGTVPHVQIDVEPVMAVNDELGMVICSRSHDDDFFP